jgi:hypothetical protein
MKEGENGAAYGNHEAVDMDAVKVEAPAVEETKELTAETLFSNADANNKVTAGAFDEPLMVTDATDCKKGPCSVIKEGAEKSSREDTSKFKEVEPPQPGGIYALIQVVPNPRGRSLSESRGNCRTLGLST